MASTVLSYAERREAKLRRTSASGCNFIASSIFLKTEQCISRSTSESDVKYFIKEKKTAMRCVTNNAEKY